MKTVSAHPSSQLLPILTTSRGAAIRPRATLTLTLTAKRSAVYFPSGNMAVRRLYNLRLYRSSLIVQQKKSPELVCSEEDGLKGSQSRRRANDCGLQRDLRRGRFICGRALLGQVCLGAAPFN